jgi:uncharacterized repeat protein (TIGR03803 family)
VQSRRWSFALVHALAIVAVTLIFVNAAWAKPKFKVLAGVGGGMFSSLTLDAKGNLYGATNGGGAYGDGMIFEVRRRPHGKWSLIVVHDFNGTDGSSPNGGMIFDRAGNLYGTTKGGGATYAGTVFKLTPGRNSVNWTYSILYSFCPEGWGSGCPEGDPPDVGVVMDSAGNLYGTTGGGGSNGYGVAFELTPGSGGWIYSVLYNFCPGGYPCKDGGGTLAGLIFGPGDGLYGTAADGGAYSAGAVFQLSYASGGWYEDLLYSFCSGGFPCKDGGGPGYGLVFDSSGGLYGTANGGANDCGGAGCGAVFELAPNGNGGWIETVLYSFRPGQSGFSPSSGLIFDKGGSLYGTAAGGGLGGCPYGCGVVYKLTPEGGKWKYTVLHKFNGTDGAWPDGVVLDERGNLYGPAYNAVFEITP